MKKILVGALALVLGTGAYAAYKDGTYEGAAKGKNGPVQVQVVVKGGKIADVQVVKHSDTPGISDAAIAEVPGAIVAKNSPEVDVVSGATYTSKGIMGGVKEALAKAK